jgi:hypothetical protein
MAIRWSRVRSARAEVKARVRMSVYFFMKVWQTLRSLPVRGGFRRGCLGYL